MSVNSNQQAADLFSDLRQRFQNQSEAENALDDQTHNVQARFDVMIEKVERQLAAAGVQPRSIH